MVGHVGEPDAGILVRHRLQLGFSLILAIGAQNAFVLRQGLLRRRICRGAFCALADMLLIVAGVAGVSLLIADFAERHAPLLFGIAALWLAAYGGLRLRSAVRAGSALAGEGQEGGSLAATVATVAILTFGNPHVYLDTVVLIGTVSLNSMVRTRSLRGGAGTAGFVFFFGLGYGASLLARRCARNAWRVLDALIAMVMFMLAWNGACRRLDRWVTRVTRRRDPHSGW